MPVNPIKILLEDGGYLPEAASEGAIAYDLRCPKDTLITTGRQIVPLNFRIELPIGYEAKIEPRSGFSLKGFEGYGASDTEHKYGTRRYDADVLSGKIDSDYRGVVCVLVKNNDVPFLLAKGTRFAQLTIYKVELLGFNLTDKLSETDRGAGGFGHSGTH